jgi:hypothetical protein
LGVCHAALWMFEYQAVALSGSAAYAATSPRGRAIVISVSTSMAPELYVQRYPLRYSPI